MASTNVRISVEAHKVLRDLARSEGASMQEVLDRALEAYRRERFLREANEEFAALRAEIPAERAVLEGALLDGLEG